MKFNWNFQRGGEGVQLKKKKNRIPCGEGMDIFCNNSIAS